MKTTSTITGTEGAGRSATAQGQQLPVGTRPLLTYAETAELLAITPRTLSRRIAAGRYRTYGEGNGKRVLYSSILDDIRRECGEVL